MTKLSLGLASPLNTADAPPFNIRQSALPTVALNPVRGRTLSSLSFFLNLDSKCYYASEAHQRFQIPRVLRWLKSSFVLPAKLKNSKVRDDTEYDNPKYAHFRPIPKRWAGRFGFCAYREFNHSLCEVN